jgi:hypothetical protein
MKFSLKNTMVLAGLVPFFCFGQLVSDVRPPAEGTIGEFTEWKSVEAEFDNNTTATIEYRIALVARKGIGCHYEVQVKNTSDQKLDIKLKSSYYDKLVKGNFGEEIMESLKPGKELAAKLIAQGCRAEKGANLSDFEACMACEFGVNIHVYRQ